MKKILAPALLLGSFAMLSFRADYTNCGITRVEEMQYEVSENSCLTANDISVIAPILAARYNMTISESQDYIIDDSGAEAAAINSKSTRKNIFTYKVARNRITKYLVKMPKLEDGGDGDALIIARILESYLSSSPSNY